jgi:hypothetical protein
MGMLPYTEFLTPTVIKAATDLLQAWTSDRLSAKVYVFPQRPTLTIQCDEGALDDQARGISGPATARDKRSRLC